MTRTLCKPEIRERERAKIKMARTLGKAEPRQAEMAVRSAGSAQTVEHISVGDCGTHRGRGQRRTLPLGEREGPSDQIAAVSGRKWQRSRDALDGGR